MRIGGLLRVVAAVAAPLWAAWAEEVCFECHEVDSKDRSASSLAWLSESIHAGFECTTCHTGVDLDDHPTPTASEVDCSMCHEEIYEAYAESVHFRKHQGGNATAPFCYDCHGSHNIRAHDDPEAPIAHTHIPDMCARCHSTVQGVRLLAEGQESPYDAYKKSIHGKLTLEEGVEGVAVCSDCHEPHRQLRKHDPRASIYKANIPATCGKCHGEITQQFEASVHGVAIANENYKAPVCTDCHAEHNILPPDAKQSRVYGANISRTTCLNCHATLHLASDQGFYEGRTFRYRDSYHGAASRAGVVEVANCASCHGIHDILPSSDPNSSINKANLPQTCGQCHPNASEHFAEGDVHRWEQAPTEKAAAWVRSIYIWLIALTLGGMFIHNAILFSFHLRRRHREVEPLEPEYQRFTKFERWQHWVLAFLFIGLVVTGFAFRFPDSWWSSWWVGSAEGFALRDFLHRLFGALFGALMLLNIYYSWATRRGRLLMQHMWPTVDDFTGAWQNIRYHLGWSKERMKVRGLFDYAEKMEYWALVWGSWVMLLTGIPMWFENWALALMPLWLLDVLRMVHLFEAILASAAIVVWHFYFVIFDPEYYPLNRSMITGRAHPRPGFEIESTWLDEPDTQAGASSTPAEGADSKPVEKALEP